jgi:hypothetical protein
MDSADSSKPKEKGSKLIAIQASPRRTGFTVQLMNMLLTGVKQSANVQIEESRLIP